MSAGDVTLTDAEREALRKSRMTAYQDGKGGWLFRPATANEQIAVVEQIVADRLAARTPTATGDTVAQQFRDLVDSWPIGDNGQDYRAAVTQCAIAVRSLADRIALDAAPTATGDDLRDRVAEVLDRLGRQTTLTAEGGEVQAVYHRELTDVLAASSAPVVSRPEAVSWVMSLDEARDLLGWLRHNRPLGMPDAAFSGLVDAIRAASLASDSEAGGDRG